MLLSFYCGALCYELKKTALLFTKTRSTINTESGNTMRKEVSQTVCINEYNTC